MLLWRLTRRPHADLSGRGGEIADGRWHSRGRPVVYCASSAALAVLGEDFPENLANLRLGSYIAVLPSSILSGDRATSSPQKVEVSVAGQYGRSLSLPEAESMAGRGIE